jgi:hypothetical protein
MTANALELQDPGKESVPNTDPGNCPDPEFPGISSGGSAKGRARQAEACLASLVFEETVVETQQQWRKPERKYLLLVQDMTQQSQQLTE